MLGSHEGIHRFIVGQRKGLGLSTGSPMYVLELRAADRQIIVGPRGVATGVVELKNRRTGEREELSAEAALARLTA